jgi:hypothetical protein
MHSLLRNSIMAAALLAAAPAFAQYGGPGVIIGPGGPNNGYDYDYGYDYGSGGYVTGPGYYGAGRGYAEPYNNGPVYEGRSEATGPSYGGNGGVAYCEQRFRSYDPASQTYLGFDGMRHPCP